MWYCGLLLTQVPIHLKIDGLWFLFSCRFGKVTPNFSCLAMYWVAAGCVWCWTEERGLEAHLWQNWQRRGLRRLPSTWLPSRRPSPSTPNLASEASPSGRLPGYTPLPSQNFASELHLSCLRRHFASETRFTLSLDLAPRIVLSPHSPGWELVLLVVCVWIGRMCWPRLKLGSVQIAGLRFESFCSIRRVSIRQSSQSIGSQSHAPPLRVT